MAPDWCDECGARHSPERRRAIIRRMLPATAGEIAAEWPCIYPDYRKNSASAQMLTRDLHAVGAVAPSTAHRDPWTVPPPCLGCGHRHGGRAYGICLVKGCDCIVVKRVAA